MREQPQHHLQAAPAGAQQRDPGVGVDVAGGQLGGDVLAGSDGGGQGFAGAGDFLLRAGDGGVLGGSGDSRVREQPGQGAFGGGQRLLGLAYCPGSRPCGPGYPRSWCSC